MTPTRQAQNNTMMYKCIKNSIEEEGKVKILAELDSYHVQGVGCGPLLFKVIMGKAVVDNRATASFYRNNLLELDSYMSTINGDVALFNHYVKQQVYNLKARGETVNDLLLNLFKGYRATSDSKFSRYIMDKQDR
jgi:hypothetical protein